MRSYGLPDIVSVVLKPAEDELLILPGSWDQGCRAHNTLRSCIPNKREKNTVCDNCKYQVLLEDVLSRLFVFT